LKKELDVKSEVILPVHYKGKELNKSFRIDMLVEDTIILELKAVEHMIHLYQAQLLSYLKLAEKPKGLLINFHCENVTNQLVSLVTDMFAALPKK